VQASPPSQVPSRFERYNEDAGEEEDAQGSEVAEDGGDEPNGDDFVDQDEHEQDIDQDASASGVSAATPSVLGSDKAKRKTKRGRVAIKGTLVKRSKNIYMLFCDEHRAQAKQDMMNDPPKAAWRLQFMHPWPTGVNPPTKAVDERLEDMWRPHAQSKDETWKYYYTAVQDGLAEDEANESDPYVLFCEDHRAQATQDMMNDPPTAAWRLQFMQPWPTDVKPPTKAVGQRLGDMWRPHAQSKDDTWQYYHAAAQEGLKEYYKVADYAKRQAQDIADAQEQKAAEAISVQKIRSNERPSAAAAAAAASTAATRTSSASQAAAATTVAAGDDDRQPQFTSEQMQRRFLAAVRNLIPKMRNNVDGEKDGKVVISMPDLMEQLVASWTETSSDAPVSQPAAARKTDKNPPAAASARPAKKQRT
jgi:hypothetical protein